MYSDRDMESNDMVADMASAGSLTPPLPTKPERRRPSTLRLNHVGIEPSELIGRVLTRVRRSPNHPSVTLDFDDHTSYQILIDGYDPVHRGVPKQLEMTPSLEPIFNPIGGQTIVDLTIVDCALITLRDKAFERRNRGIMGAEWDQNHLGIAFKFGDETQRRWHCVWATLVEYDDMGLDCVFRSYDDVYLDKLERPNTTQKTLGRKETVPTKAQNASKKGITKAPMTKPRPVKRTSTADNMIPKPPSSPTKTRSSNPFSNMSSTPLPTVPFPTNVFRSPQKSKPSASKAWR